MMPTWFYILQIGRYPRLRIDGLRSRSSGAFEGCLKHACLEVYTSSDVKVCSRPSRNAAVAGIYRGNLKRDGLKPEGSAL